MGSDHEIAVAVVAIVCVLGAASVLVRIAIERDRLLSRYSHIRMLMQHQEMMKVHLQEAADSVASEASFIDPADASSEDVTVVSPVSES